MRGDARDLYGSYLLIINIVCAFKYCSFQLLGCGVQRMMAVVYHADISFRNILTQRDPDYFAAAQGVSGHGFRDEGHSKLAFY